MTICQLEIIGRPFKKYERDLARCRNLLNSAVIVALLYRASGVCQQEEIGKQLHMLHFVGIFGNFLGVVQCFLGVKSGI